MIIWVKQISWCMWSLLNRQRLIISDIPWSTKIPEYLSVGRPIFCYGPEEIATVAYLAEKRAGMVATQMQDVRDSLLRLVCDQALRETLGHRALQVAQEEHLGSMVGARMENVFQEAAVMWKNR